MTTRIRGADIKPRHFQWQVDGKVATITLTRPERKNPLTFEAYAELRDTFRQLAFATDIKVVVITGAEGNFSSGGDVHEIIGPLVKMKREGKIDELLALSRNTGERPACTRVPGDGGRAMRTWTQASSAAVDAGCAGAGAILAMAGDLRIGASRSRGAVPFPRVGLSGADTGACAMLPRIIGHG